MIRIREATQEDSDGLIDLTAKSPMQGAISIRIDRQPDFFALLRQRGDFFCLVAEDERQQIVGSFTATQTSCIIDGTEKQAHYLGDLKVHPAFAGTTVGYRLVRDMYEYLSEHNADILFCTTADGNKAVQPFFEGRAGIPPFTRAGKFCIYQLLPLRKDPGCDSVDVNPRSDRRLAPFYETYYSRYRFYPSRFDLAPCTHFIKIRSGRLTAAVSVMDTSSLKQNVLIDCSAGLSVLLNLSTRLSPLVNTPVLPRKNEIIRTAYLRYYALDTRHAEDFSEVLKSARHWAAQQHFHFLSIAVHDGDRTLKRILRPGYKFRFESYVFITSLKNTLAKTPFAPHVLISEDYSLV